MGKKALVFCLEFALFGFFFIKSFFVQGMLFASINFSSLIGVGI